jgi:hypothetical protein
MDTYACRNEKTHQLLPVYQPLIHLAEVEYMLTWQHPYFVTLDKIGQADGTFDLSLKPRSKIRIRIGAGRGRVVGCPV